MEGLHGRSPCALYLMYCIGHFLLQAKAVRVLKFLILATCVYVSSLPLCEDTEIFLDLNSTVPPVIFLVGLFVSFILPQGQSQVDH